MSLIQGHYLGVDTGGTFTDFVYSDGKSLRVHKVLSTPHAPEEAILQGIREMQLPTEGLKVVHGSTVATNAVLEGKGVKTAYITNQGLADVLTIGRQARKDLYDLQPQEPRPPVEAELCLVVDCRLSAQGQWLAQLDQAKLEQLARRVDELDAEAVAVNLLFSFLDDKAEKQIREILPKQLFVSLSSEVLPEIREYERGMATWLNAWVGPLMQTYLNRLQQALKGSHLAIMQSSGETMHATQAASQAVRLLLSGPAGGLVGAKHTAALSGCKRLMTFDMGGTSTDVALIDGDIQLTSEGKIGDYPVAVPMVDMHTIGAGGGSIAYLDAGGMLQVGPQSAGASPGPACYGRGGQQPTVTDANLVLGRIPSDASLGGYMKLDLTAANKVMDELAGKMSCSRQEAALGIISIANEHMARALRIISVQKGYDPRDFILVCFGGAGGLHVCALAEELDMSEAMVPIHAGVLSALGMLATKPGRQLSQTNQGLLKDFTGKENELEAMFDELRQQGEAALLSEGVDAGGVVFSPSLDLRYLGQSHTLNIDWSDADQCLEDFGILHQRRYGHSMDVPVELVNLRLSVTGPELNLYLADSEGQDIVADKTGSEALAVYPRDSLRSGVSFDGPAIITEAVSTTWLAPGWFCEKDAVGNLLLRRNG